MGGSLGRKRAKEEGAGSRIPKVWEAREIGKNCTTICNILQLKKCKEVGTKNNGVGIGLKGYGRREG